MAALNVGRRRQSTIFKPTNSHGWRRRKTSDSKRACDGPAHSTRLANACGQREFCAGCPTRLHRPRQAGSSAVPSRPSHPAPNVRDDRETPLFKGCGTARNVTLIWGSVQCYADAADWHDGQIRCGQHISRQGFCCSSTNEAIASYRR